MITIKKFKLLAGSHHDPASGNTYDCTPDKTVPPKPDAEDQNTTVIHGKQPVFESVLDLDKVFRNKFQKVSDDTPVTDPPDASALRAKAANEQEARDKAAAEKEAAEKATTEKKGSRKN